MPLFRHGLRPQQQHRNLNDLIQAIFFTPNSFHVKRIAIYQYKILKKYCSVYPP